MTQSLQALGTVSKIKPLKVVILAIITNSKGEQPLMIIHRSDKGSLNFVFTNENLLKLCLKLK